MFKILCCDYQYLKRLLYVQSLVMSVLVISYFLAIRAAWWSWWLGQFWMQVGKGMDCILLHLPICYSFTCDTLLVS
jgi:hypothetical protein